MSIISFKKFTMLAITFFLCIVSPRGIIVSKYIYKNRYCKKYHADLHLSRHKNEAFWHSSLRWDCSFLWTICSWEMCSWLKCSHIWHFCAYMLTYICVHARDFIWKMFLKVVFVWNIPEWGGAGGLLLVLGNAGRAAEGQLPEER